MDIYEEIRRLNEAHEARKRDRRTSHERDCRCADCEQARLEAMYSPESDAGLPY